MRLLLAEDESSLSKAIVSILKKNSMEADAVDNGADALDYLLSSQYDGAILDIMMPGMDGITVLKKVREAGVRIPILMLTAKAEIDDKVLGLDSGANDYLTKPFATQELLARIRAMLRTQSMQQTSKLTFGNISLDCSTFDLSSPFGSYRLTNKEYQLMEILLLHPGHLISTETLMEKVWGYNSEAELHVVWVYISYLRKKLLSLQADISIKSARNAGYTLILNSL